MPNPFGTNSAFSRQVFSDWEVSGVGLIQSGVPYSVTNSLSGQAWDGDIGSGGAGFADYVGGPTDTPVPPRAAQRLSGEDRIRGRAAHALWNTGPQQLRGPGQANLDFAVQKRFKLWESVGLNFRTEFFNIFNQPNFSNPNGSLDSSTFGVISSTNANARIIQFGLKLTF